MGILKFMMRIMKRFVGQTPDVRSCRVYPGENVLHAALHAGYRIIQHNLVAWGLNMSIKSPLRASFVNKVVCWSMIPRSVQCRCRAKAHQTLA